MALYGGNVGSYTTPDGRVVQMPAGLAGMFPSLQPQVAMPGPPPPGQQVAAGSGGPPELGGPALPPVGAPAGPPPGAPDAMTDLPLPTGTNPTWSPQDSADLAKQTQAAKQAQDQAELQALAKKQRTNPAMGRAAAAQDSGATTTNPDGTVTTKPLTNTDLAKMGVATPANAALAAEEQKKQAIEGKTTAEADQAVQVAAAMKANNEADKKRLDDAQAEADRRQAQLDQHNQDLMTQAKKIADTKIDRTVDHPWLTAIGVALATLGTAMQNRDAALAAAFRGGPAPTPIENPGLKAMYAAIDRKVAAQMGDLDKQKDAYGLQQQAVTSERGTMKDRLDQMAASRLGYLEHAKQEIDRLTKETSVPLIKANGEIAKADITREQAATVGEAQQRMQAQQNAAAARSQTMKIAQMGEATARRGQDLQYQMHGETLAAQRQEKAAALAEKLIDAKGAAGAAQAKLIQEQGVFDPSTGDYMLTPAGQAKMAQADKLEAQARTAATPEQAQKMNELAQQNRLSARMNDTATAPNKEMAKDAYETVKSAQDLTNRINTVIGLLKTEPDAWDREKWATAKTYIDGIKRDYAQSGKERLSPTALNSMGDLLSIDPESLWSREADRGKAVAALTALKQQTKQSTDVTLKAVGIKSGWTPQEPTPDTEYGDLTAQEIADRSVGSRGIVGMLDAASGGAVANPLRQQAYETAMRRTGRRADGSQGRPSEYGLAPRTEETVDSLVARAKGAGESEYKRVLESLAVPLVKITEREHDEGEENLPLRERARPSLAKGVAEKLHNSDPKLLDDVLDYIASRPGGGQVKADAIRKALPTAPEVSPASNGGLTPDAAADLAFKKDRVRRGLPPVPSLSTDRPPEPPEPKHLGPRLPDFIRNSSPDVQRRYIEAMRNNGFGNAFPVGNTL